MTERTCDYSKCDETFPRGGRRRYCCRLHKEKARKEDRGPHRPCAWCGTSFVTTGSRRYCSSGCSWAGARHIINAEKNAGSLDLRCRWIPPEPVERYRGAYYHALKADPCAYCGEPAGSIDHIDPSSRGGTNEHDNLTGACSSCNSSKHRKPLLRHMLLRLIARDLDPLLAEYAAAGDLENIPQSHEEAASQHQDGVGLCSTGLAVWGRCDGGVRARKILLSFLLHQLFFGGARVGDSRDVARS